MSCTETFISEGTCTINANQLGNQNYNAAAQETQQVQVLPKVTTTTTVYSSINPYQGAPSSITFSAQVNSGTGIPTGSVTFSSNNQPINSCNNVTLDETGMATCQIQYSSLTPSSTPLAIAAMYNGSADYITSTSATFNQYVISGGATIPSVPAAPMEVTVVPGNDQVTVSWFPPTNTGGQTITGYTVKYGPVGGPFTSTGCSTSDVAPNLSCTVTSLTNNTAYIFTVAASNASGTGPVAYSSSVTPTNTISAIPTNLALNGTGNGLSRTIAITNGSGNSVTISSTVTSSSFSPSLPTGTTVSSTTCNEGIILTPNGGACTVTIAPGSTVSNDTSTPTALPCTQGQNLTASSVMTVQTSGGSTTANVVVLGYGCIYQSGYLYSINDFTPPTSSIGGRLFAQIDQSASSPWNDNGDNSPIWGIDDFSNIAFPDPTPNNAPQLGQLNCNASNDGACATNNIIVQYPTVSDWPGFAAGLCQEKIDNLTDWYLPSVCDLGPFGSSQSTSGNYPLLPNSQTCFTNNTNIQDKLVGTGILSSLNNKNYWSSTEAASDPQNESWYQVFSSTSGGGSQTIFHKGSTYYVRCVRSSTI